MEMKRTINHIMTSAAVLLSLSSCDLDLKQMDQVHPEHFFTDAASLDAWMNYCYKEFDGQESMLRDADDFISAHPSEFLAGTRTPATQTWDWSVLTQINRYHQYKSLCKDEEAIARYDAEAMFFHALFYADKVRQFGDVPYYDSMVGPDAAPVATDRDIIMTDVCDEFMEASEELTDEVFDIPVRINRWVALGFMARAALFEGTYLKYSDEEGWDYYLKECVKACEKIMDSGKFRIYTATGWKSNNAYRNLFAMETMAPEEALLVKLYDTDVCPSQIDMIFGRERLGATSRFVNHYQLLNGKGIQDVRSGYESEDINEVFQARDPRLAQTLLMPGCRYLDTDAPVINSLNSMTGYQPVKFQKSADATKLAACFPVLRYAEILLAYAEAKAELGTITQADLDRSVNLIRARVGMPAISLLETYGGADRLMESYYPNVPASKYKGIILEIRRERTIELALEGRRQWDIMRWHEGARIGNTDSKIQGLYIPAPGLIDLNGDKEPDVELYTSSPVQSSVKALKIGTDIILSEGTRGHVVAFDGECLPEEEWDEDRDYLWPIPASEFRVPGSRLLQNYGY